MFFSLEESINIYGQQVRSGVRELSVFTDSSGQQATVKIKGTPTSVGKCLNLLRGILGYEALKGTHRQIEDYSAHIELRVTAPVWEALPYVEKCLNARIAVDVVQGNLCRISVLDGSVAAKERAVKALQFLSVSEAFVSVHSGTEKSSKLVTHFPIAMEMLDAARSEFDGLPEIVEYRNGPKRILRGARDMGSISFGKTESNLAFVSVTANGRELDSILRVLDPLLWGDSPVAGWERWLAGGVGWEFAKNQMATRAEWTMRFQECRDWLMAANEMTGDRDLLREFLYYKDPATGGSVQRLRGSGGRYEEVITDVRKFLEYLMYCAVVRRKKIPGSQGRIWDRIEKICIRNSDPSSIVPNGGLLRSSSRGPDVPCQWSAHAHESTYPFAMVTEETQKELLRGIQTIVQMLVEDIGGQQLLYVQQKLRLNDVQLSEFKKGDVVEVTSGNLKGKQFLFEKWTTAECLSAKLTSLEGQPLDRAVKRSQLKLLSSVVIL
eukprot:CAMPEP_0177603314 /NCGR_PEP_ID=MMETSP0419_2-20121207/15443_1 /TAXON_ID=582737 /ORGANISM="Tetraselmis sp., Strain GSL018" /LENGTH=493 /DNA_ID=CAMNT_0019097071 /DNA_START=496 /DNA_END=1978 /DNA_ORIENTATION=+